MPFEKVEDAVVEITFKRLVEIPPANVDVEVFDTMILARVLVPLERVPATARLPDAIRPCAERSPLLIVRDPELRVSPCVTVSALSVSIF